MPSKTATPEASLEAFAATSNKAMKENVERTMSAFGDFNAFSKDNVEALVESVTKTGKGVEEINSHVMAYAKQTMEESVTAAKRMAGAKSVQEVLELQTDYAKSSVDSYIGEVSKMTDLMATAFKDAFKPLNARMSAAVEMMQAQR